MAGKFNIKCGVINEYGKISQDKGFKFFTWTASSNTLTENQFTLTQRVKELYPDMEEPYQIICIDEQNERVVLSPDDFKETIAAFLCLQSKIDNNRPIRICIQPLTVVLPGNCDGQIHYGIACSNCHKKPITGFRYDCTQCPNYILCGRCDTAGYHREHNFLRISKPVQYPSFLLSEKSDSMTSIPSLQHTIQNLGDRLVNQLNSFELSVTNSIFKATGYIQKPEGKVDAELEEVTDTLEKV